MADTTTTDGLDDPETRRCVEDFLLDYAHTLDDGELEAWPGFFSEDAFYQVITRESFEAGHPMGIMTCDGRGMLEDRIKALRQANIFEPHVYCHILGRPRLRRLTSGEVGARANFNVMRTMQDGRTEIFAVGKYLDRIVFDGAVPKLRERRVILDSRRIDILLVVPL